MMNLAMSVRSPRVSKGYERKKVGLLLVKPSLTVGLLTLFD